MVLERKRDEFLLTDKCIVIAMCGVQRKDGKKIYRLDADIGFEWNYRLVVFGKHCWLV